MEQEDIILPPKEDVLIEYVKEKDSLKAELKEKDKELQKQRSKIYDLQEKLEELKKERQALNNSSNQQTSNKLAVARPTTGRSRSPVMSKRGKSAKQKPQKSKSQRNDSTSNSTPNLNAKFDSESNQEDLKKRIEHLEEVAKRYPELKLSVILEAERVFNEGDINNDGTIDEEELEKLLIKQGHLFTNKELKEIMSQIDVDNNQAIDVMEYLAVMERVQQRKRVNLPTAITRSAACVIQ